MGKKFLILIGIIFSFSSGLLSQSIIDIFYDELPSTYQADKKLRENENKILKKGYNLDPVLIYYYMEYIQYYHKKIMYQKGKNFRHLYFIRMNEMVREKNNWLKKLKKFVMNDTSISDILKNRIINELQNLLEKEFKGNWIESPVRINKNKQYYYAYKAVARNKQLKYQSDTDYPKLYSRWIKESRENLLASFEKSSLSNKEKKVLFHEILKNWYIFSN